MLALTERGRRALDLDHFGISLPASYHAWGAADSPLCENGHPRVDTNVMRNGGCQKCRWVDVGKKRRQAAA